MSTAQKKLKNQPGSPERGATANGLAQMAPMPARSPKEQSGRPQTKTPTPSSGDDSSEASPDAPNEADGCARIMAMLGTTDLQFAKGIYAQLISASSRADGRYDAVGLFFSLAAIKGKKPKTEFQAMLAAQAAVTHVLTMKSATRLGQAEDLAALDSAERAYNKLARTFIMQLEALNRLETGGEQKVTVQNVSVNEGGQAIVGNVTQGARDQAVEKTPALTDARQAPMPIIGTPASSVPVKRGRNNDEPSST
jgi:hypothetical protein